MGRSVAGRQGRPGPAARRPHRAHHPTRHRPSRHLQLLCGLPGGEGAGRRPAAETHTGRRPDQAGTAATVQVRLNLAGPMAGSLGCGRPCRPPRQRRPASHSRLDVRRVAPPGLRCSGRIPTACAPAGRRRRPSRASGEPVDRGLGGSGSGGRLGLGREPADTQAQRPPHHHLAGRRRGRHPAVRGPAGPEPPRLPRHRLQADLGDGLDGVRRRHWVPRRQCPAARGAARHGIPGALQPRCQASPLWHTARPRRRCR